jgi:hypothetical protein
MHNPAEDRTIRRDHCKLILVPLMIRYRGQIQVAEDLQLEGVTESIEDTADDDKVDQFIAAVLAVFRRYDKPLSFYFDLEIEE